MFAGRKSSFKDISRYREDTTFRDTSVLVVTSLLSFKEIKVFLHCDIDLKLILTSHVGNMFYSCISVIKICMYMWCIHRSILSVLITFNMFLFWRILLCLLAYICIRCVGVIQKAQFEDYHKSFTLFFCILFL